MTSARTLCCTCEIVSQSMYLASVEPSARVTSASSSVKAFHAALGVLDHEPFVRAEQLVRDDQRANRVVARASPGVSDHVGVALAQPRELGRIEPGVHAREDRECASRRLPELRPGAEVRGVLGICSQNLLENTHQLLLSSIGHRFLAF